MGMMVNRRRVCGGKKGLLPSGYRQVEYIENTSNAYIDTGFNATGGCEIEFKASNTFDVGSHNVPGDSDNYYGRNFVDLTISNNRLRLRFEKRNSMLEIYTTSNNINNVYFNTIGKTKKLIINSDVIQNLTNVSPVTCKTEVEIFWHYGNKSPEKTTDGRFYYVKIKDKDYQLVRNFIPCKDPTNVVGMYDTVEGKFYSSPNGTAFVAGQEV